MPTYYACCAVHLSYAGRRQKEIYHDNCALSTPVIIRHHISFSVSYSTASTTPRMHAFCHSPQTRAAMHVREVVSCSSSGVNDACRTSARFVYRYEYSNGNAAGTGRRNGTTGIRQDFSDEGCEGDGRGGRFAQCALNTSWWDGKSVTFVLPAVADDEYTASICVGGLARASCESGLSSTSTSGGRLGPEREAWTERSAASMLANQ